MSVMLRKVAVGIDQDVVEVHHYRNVKHIMKMLFMSIDVDLAYIISSCFHVVDW